MLLLLDVLGPLEEEDEAVDVGLYSVDEVVVLERVNFFDLHGGGSHLLDQFGEDPRVGLDCAPLIKHDYSNLYMLRP